MAVSRPNCLMGCTSVARSERKPAIVESVVRIIGVPIWRSVVVIRSTTSSVRAHSS